MNKKIRNIEESRRHRRTRDQFKGVKGVRDGYQARTNLVKDKDGKMLINEEEIKERWKEYFSELLNRPDPRNPLEDQEANHEALVDITEDEIIAAIKHLKNNKAAGVDNICAELLKNGGPILQAKLVDLFKLIWAEERLPEEWEEGIMVPLHKKNDRAECSNYRGLCLLTVGYKAYAAILCERLAPYYTQVVGEYQAGFVGGKSTADNIFMLRQIAEKYREFARTSWHVFVDYKQAYDSVHRPSLWNILRYFNIPEKLIRLIKACYTNSRSCVRVGGVLTNSFAVETGLRQGCPLSCMLFNLTLEWVMRNTPSMQDEVSLTNGVLCDRLAYADDADLMGETFQGRDRQLGHFNETGSRVGLEVSEGKTKVMKMSREQRTEEYIELGGFLLEEVDSFKYLGSIICVDNTMEEEIAERIAGASKCSWSLNALLKSKLLTRRTKIQLYTTIVRPVLTYACETWTLTKELERRLLVFKHSVLRRMLGPVRDEVTGEWRIRHNRELRELTRLPPVTSFVRAQRLRWAGHVARMDPVCLLRRVFDGTPEGRRPPGRP